MVPAWILDSPLKAGIATMEAGGRLGLAARGEDLRQAAQADAAAEASDRLALSMQEMQARREQAAAQLAESLRQHSALQQYRKSEIANRQSALQQAKENAAATALRAAQQQQNWTTEHQPPSVNNLPGFGNVLVSGSGHTQLPPASVFEAQAITSKLKDAEDAEKSGNAALGTSLRREAAMIESRLVPPSEKIEVSPSGVSITRGGTSAGGNVPTTATKTELQRQLNSYDSPMATIRHIEDNMQASDFGLRGVMGEMADRYGAQIKPEMADPRRESVRNSLGLLRSDLYKALRSDSNITKSEQEQIASLLPSEGISESLPRAAQMLSDVKARLTLHARNNAAKLGVLPPLWALSMDETLNAAKTNQITREQLSEALNNYHSTEVRKRLTNGR